MDRAAKLAEIRGDRELQAAWRETAEEIRADILEHGMTAGGVLRQHYETDALDASTLLAAIFGFLPSDDPRLRASVLAIAEDLTEQGFVLRYRTGETDDGLSGKEGTFLICSFWLVSALAIDRRGAAGARPDGAPAARSPRPSACTPRSSTPSTGRHLGNFPQAFSHLALIEAAAQIILAERARGVHVSDYDVIVIGSGAGGGTLAHHLAPSGKRILLLERGDWLPREPQNWSAADVFVDGRYISPDTWYYDDGTPFQPQVHYFVGGATKLYGAALYRLREADFGELRHVDGVSPAWPIAYDELEPYYTQAEQLYEVHGARGEDPTEPPASAPYPCPAGLARAAHPAALRRPGRGGPASVPRAVRRPARRVRTCPTAAACAARTATASRALVHAKSDAEVIGGAPGARARQRHAADRRRGRAPRDRRDGPRGHRSGRRPRRPAGGADAPTSSSSRAARRTARGSCSRRRARRTRTGWPTAPTRSGATTCSTTARRCWRCRASPTRRCSRRRSGSTTSTSRATPGSTRWATSRWSASRRRRCSAASGRGETRAGARRGRCATSPRHAVDFWLSTEDLPRPDNRVTLAPRRPDRASRYTGSNDAAKKRLYQQLKSMLSHLGMHHDHLLGHHAYLKNEIPVAGVAHQAGRAASATIPPPRCSTPTAARTRSTTSTSSTRASSRASAR